MSSQIISPKASDTDRLNQMEQKRQYFRQHIQPMDAHEDVSSMNSQLGNAPIEVITVQSRPSQLKKLQTFLSRKSMKSSKQAKWQSHPLRIIHLTSKFLQILKTQTHEYKFKLLNANIMAYIGDSTAQFAFYLKQGLIAQRLGRWNLFKQTLSNMFGTQWVPTFQPEHSMKIIFDVIVLVSILANLLYIPLKICFNLDSAFDGIEAQLFLDYFPSMVLVLDILVKFNTAYYSNGIIHQGHSDIIEHYLKKDFWSDLVVVLPFFLTGINIPWLKFILFFRIFKLPQIIGGLERKTSIRENFAALIDLSKLIFTVLYVCHICACIWNLIGQYELDNISGTNWIIEHQMQNSSWESRYITSFYWSCITAMTVGYGDIVPVNDLERGVCILVVITTSIVFGYSISSIGTIFSQISEKETKYKNSLAQISSYIKKKKLTPDLQHRVKKYFEYTFDREIRKSEANEQLMEHLSQDLKIEVNTEQYLPLITRCQGFKNLTQKCLKDLCQILKIRRFKPGDALFNKHDTIKELLFVLHGSVEMSAQLKSQRITLKNYSKGYVLAMKNFFTQEQVAYSCHAKDFVEVAVLDYSQFYEIISQDEEDLENLQLIKDNLAFNKYYKLLKEVCLICSSSHSLINCPYPFYQINENKLLRSKGHNHERISIKRKLTQSKSFRSNRKEVQDSALAVTLNLGILNEGFLDEQYSAKLGLFNCSTPDQDLDSIAVVSDINLVQIKSPFKKEITIKEPTAKRFSNDSAQMINFNERIHRIRGTESYAQLKPLNSLNDIYEELNMIQCLKFEYLNFIKQDSLQELDSIKEYNFYYANCNFSKVIPRVNLMAALQLKIMGKTNRFSPLMKKSGSMYRGGTTLNIPVALDDSTPAYRSELFLRRA